MTKQSKTTFKPTDSMTSSYGTPVRCAGCGAVLVVLHDGTMKNTVIECNSCKRLRRWAGKEPTMRQPRK